MGKHNKLVFGNYDKKHRRNKKFLIYLSILFILLLGYLYQTYSIYSKASSYGRVGKLIDVNGSMMHLYSSGFSEMPLVFASNIGTSAPYTEWQPLLAKLPESTTVAVYDKFGYGWSDFTKEPRDITVIASEIHSLLHQADYPFPALFVAHSMGSLEVFRYAQLYPEDVAGIILIDGASPEFCSKYNNIMIVESFLINGLRNTGLLRLFKDTEIVQQMLNPNDALPETFKDLNEALTLEKLWNRNVIQEKLKIRSNAETIITAGSLKDIPLRIITSRANPYGTWQQTQSAMRKFSTNSTQTYIEGSVNFLDDEDISHIKEVIDELTTFLQNDDE